MLHSDLQTEQDARDMMDLTTCDRCDGLDGCGAGICNREHAAKVLQRTDGELALLHKRLAAEFQFPDFTEDETFVAVPMPGTSASNIDDRFPE